MSSDPHLALVRYDPNAEMSAHAHDEPGVSIVLVGSIFEAVGSAEEFGNIGDVVVKPGGVAHRNRVAPAGAVLLAIKGQFVEGVLEPGWRWARTPGAGAIGLRAAHLLLENQKEEATEVALSLLELLGGTSRKATRANPQIWLRHIRERIEDEVEHSTVSVLAQTVGVHPGSLTRAFRLHYGHSVSGYIRRVRVRRAAQLLSRTEQTVGQIAAAIGCYDQSHLCREFNIELGTSPSFYRRMIRRGSR
jgi:AraC-like DNA-binding protein